MEAVLSAAKFSVLLLSDSEDGNSGSSSKRLILADKFSNDTNGSPLSLRVGSFTLSLLKLSFRLVGWQLHFTNNDPEDARSLLSFASTDVLQK